MEKKRYVRKDFYFGRYSSWHCAETSSFFNSLAEFKSGIGRKTLKGALVLKMHCRSINDNGFLVIRYVFPAETSFKSLKNACTSWNNEHGKLAPAVLSASCTADGTLCNRAISLELKGWDIDPMDIHSKEVNNG